MPEHEGVGDRAVHAPVNIVDAINKIVRTSREMLPEIGREATPEELAQKLTMPLEKVRKLLKIARLPITLEMAAGYEEPHLG